jgi:Domain of unknown function (DUF6457)
MLDAWVRQLCGALGVPVEAIDVDGVLDLAREAAHSVDRPAAPVTAYIVGYAAGQRSDDAAAAGEAAQTAARLARDWVGGASP